jgi:hypothetical protein
MGKTEYEEKRERQPHVKDANDKNAGKPSANDGDRQGNAQKKAVERHEAQLKENEEMHARVNTNTKLVTKEYHGNVPGEQFKKDEEEDNKVGRFGFGAGVKDAVKKIETIPLKVAGRVVDQIVVNPAPAGKTVAGALTETEPMRVQKVLDKHFGKDKEEGDSEDAKARDEAEKRAAGANA